MAKHKRVSPGKTFAIALVAIALFLITSTVYDWMMGDMDYRRKLTLPIAGAMFLSAGLLVGFKKLWHMIQEGWVK